MTSAAFRAAEAVQRVAQIIRDSTRIMGLNGYLFQILHPRVSFPALDS